VTRINSFGVANLFAVNAPIHLVCTTIRLW